MAIVIAIDRLADAPSMAHSKSIKSTYSIQSLTMSTLFSCYSSLYQYGPKNTDLKTSLKSFYRYLVKYKNTYIQSLSMHHIVFMVFFSV